MILKSKLFLALIITTPNWNLDFEMMCDVSLFALDDALAHISLLALDDALGQKKSNFFHPIYFYSKTLNCFQMNYTVREKELLSIVYGFNIVEHTYFVQNVFFILIMSL